MTISFSELTFKVGCGLLFRAIKNHRRRHAVPVENQGQCLMCLTFSSHWVCSCPSKGCGVDLRTFITSLGYRSSEHGIGKGRVWESLVVKHPVVSRESPQKSRVQACSNAALGRSLDSPFCARRGYQPPSGKRHGVNRCSLAGPHITIQASAHARDHNIGSTTSTVREWSSLMTNDGPLTVT